MGYSKDDAVHKIPHKMKTHRQNQLKISVLVYFKILCRIRYKKIDVILVQCPLKVRILEESFSWCLSDVFFLQIKEANPLVSEKLDLAILNEEYRDDPVYTQKVKVGHLIWYPVWL